MLGDHPTTAKILVAEMPLHFSHIFNYSEYEITVITVNNTYQTNIERFGKQNGPCCTENLLRIGR